MRSLATTRVDGVALLTLATILVSFGRAGADGSRVAAHCQIAFYRNDYGQNIALYDTVTGKTRDVTYGQNLDESPSWSPNGMQLVFTRQADEPEPGVEGRIHVWLTDLSGLNERELTHSRYNDSFPSWSPDGRRVAFFRGAGLYVLQAATGVTRFVVKAGSTDGPAAWNGDGRHLAYRDREGIELVDLHAHSQRLIAPGGASPQYLQNGILSYLRADGRFVRGHRALTAFPVAGPGAWTQAGSRWAYEIAPDPNLNSPPPAQLAVRRLDALRTVHHLRATAVAGAPAWQPGCA
jgi:dipeptidyl aminopeptidase/acylaminoacyl peptidase